MSLTYVVMLNVWPLSKYTPVTYPDTLYTNMGLFFIECIASVVLILTTGPFKVFLDVKRGATSIKEISDGYEDSRTWMHKQVGVDDGILPNRQPERAGLRKRDVKPSE